MDVGYEDVEYDVCLAFILAEGSYAYAMATVTVEVLDEDVGAVGFERYTI